jgi:hypothetical protein
MWSRTSILQAILGNLKSYRLQYTKYYADVLNKCLHIVLETNRFIIISLCLTNDCAVGHGDEYREYVADIEMHLGATIEYRQDN